MPWRPPAVSRGVGHRPSVTWPQCRGHLSRTSLFVNPLGLISALGIKEDFLATSVSNVTRVLLFCSKPDPLLGPGVLRGLDSGDCTSQDHSGVHSNSQPRLWSSCGCRESNPSFLVPEKTQHPWQLSGGCPPSGGRSDSLVGFLRGRPSHTLETQLRGSLGEALTSVSGQIPCIGLGPLLHFCPQIFLKSQVSSSATTSPSYSQSGTCPEVGQEQ